MENGWRIALLMGWLLILWIIEQQFPFRKNDRSHTVVNIGLTIIMIVINFFMAMVAVQVAHLCDRYQIGVFHWFAVNTFWKAVIGLLFLDFWSAYLSHLLMHKIPWLWKFHEIHHADTMVDVSTAFRHHPVEIFYRTSFHITGMALLGASFPMLVIYQTLSSLNAQLEHSNIRFNQTVDKIFSLVFVTPNFHKVHHLCKQPYTDSNYGNIFSLWDRLFRTREVLKNGLHIKYGLDQSRVEQKANSLQVPFIENTHNSQS